MRRRRFYYRRKQWAPMGRLPLVMLFILFVFSVFVFKMRPMIMEYAVNLVQYTTTQAINKAVNEKIYENRANYQNLVQLQRDNDSHVTALTTDMITINNMKTEILNCVYDCLNSLEKSKLEIPLGNVIDEDFFAGMGPNLYIGMAGLGSAKAEFISAFTAAGINQTRHSMILEVTVKTKVLSPAGNREVTVVSRFNITDTVIVGTVPETYTYIDDTENSLLGKINDYTDNTPYQNADNASNAVRKP